MLLYEQVYGDVFDRIERKCRAVLMKHFQCKAKFFLETGSLYC